MTDDKCYASWDCDGLGGLDCELPPGHDGQHKATIEWDEAPPKPVAQRPLSISAYDLFIMRIWKRADIPDL